MSTSHEVATTHSARLLQIDGLRGLAALAVVGFHFTTRFDDVFKPAQRSALELPWGHYGVNLFFIISGFVIFMTLDRTRHATAFVVSRFSRLYPAYWVAVMLTFTITHTLGPPALTVPGLTALANALMFHGLLGVASVDGAYWTLEVELLFYVGMLGLYASGQLRNVHVWMLGLLGVRWLYFGAASAFGVELPWRLYGLLILKHLPWFIIGIAISSWLQWRQGGDRRPWMVTSAAAALVTLLFTEPPWHAGLALALGALVFLAATGRLRWLNHALFVGLGAVSYPLYLLHENIGWALIHQGLQAGWTRLTSVWLAFVVVMALAWAVARWVERPALRAIRRAYKPLGR